MNEASEQENVRRRLVGNSQETAELRRLITLFAPAEIAVWIEGETGVGKEQAAIALHEASGRRGAFVPVNVCAIPESMFEDTFYGHVRGAFTGAYNDSAGLFGEAEGGTLFLDEVSSLPLASQAKLLRAVEMQRFRQVGARADRSCRVRIVAASNEPYEELLRTGRLRPDFAFRLRGGVLHIPPLRTRPSDVRPLVEHFLAKGPAGGASIEHAAVEWLSARSWKGNVRQLRQVVDCARALSVHPRVGLSEIRHAARMQGVDSTPATEVAESSAARDKLLAILAEYSWDTKRVANALDVDRTTVYRRMKRYSIERRMALQSAGAVRPSPDYANHSAAGSGRPRLVGETLS